MDYEEFDRLVRDGNTLSREDALKCLASDVDDIRRLAASHCLPPEDAEMQAQIVAAGELYACYGLAEAKYVDPTSQRVLVQDERFHPALAENRHVLPEVQAVLVESSDEEVLQDLSRNRGLDVPTQLRLIQRDTTIAALGFGHRDDLALEVIVAFTLAPDRIMWSRAAKRCEETSEWSAEMGATFLIYYAPQEVAGLAPEVPSAEIEALASSWNGSLASLVEALELTQR